MPIYRIIILLLMFSLVSCKQEAKKTSKAKSKPAITQKVNPAEKMPNEIQFSEKELVSFMDSVAKLSSQKLQNKVAYRTDSLFKSIKNTNRQLSTQEFKQLKLAIKEEKIKLNLAKSIFGNFQIDSMDVDEGKISIQLFSFDRNKTDYHEFAVILGWPKEFQDNSLYFFKSDKLLANVTLNFRYELEIKNFKDSEGKTIVYYKQNFQSGVGIWWYNYYFYKYDGEKLIPVLNELENANMTWPLCRNLWLESTIVKTNPLTLKMVYRQRFYENMSNEIETYIVNDSTFVQYNWDEKSKTLTGDYSHSKINKPEILTYYLEDNELLFIKTHYQLLKQQLSDPSQKKIALSYLNRVKNRF